MGSRLESALSLEIAGNVVDVDPSGIQCLEHQLYHNSPNLPAMHEDGKKSCILDR